MSQTQRRYVGVIDLGGTKIYSAVLDDDGRMMGEDLRRTPALDGPDQCLDRMVASLTAAAGNAQLGLSSLSGIGVAAPGLVNAATGHVVNPPNLPGWEDVALGPILAKRLALNVIVENDANAAALGEYLMGAGQGAETFVYVTVSTGIGGGIVLGGLLHRGSDGMASEIGHMVIQPGGPVCACGNRGCLEALASGTALAREGQAAIQAGQAPILERLAAQNSGEVTSELVARAAAEGDTGAELVLQEAGESLGIGLGNLVNILNPDVIAIGGGAAQIGPALLGPAERMMRAIAFPILGARVKFREALLEYPAIRGLVGLVEARWS